MSSGEIRTGIDLMRTARIKMIVGRRREGLEGWRGGEVLEAILVPG